MRRPQTPILALLAFAVAAPVGAQQLAINEWEVPWGAEGRPRDPYVHPDGRVFFVGQAGNYIAALDPKSGDFQRFEIEEGTHPHNLIIDSEGMIWYAGNRNGRIGRLDPKTGDIEVIMMPDPAARDPHTLTFDSKQNIWFTLQGSNMIGRLDRATREVHLLRVPTERARPYGIVVDGNDRPWVVLVGTNKIATVDPATMQLEEIVLPREAARPRRVALTSDGAVWYGDWAEGYIGRLDPTTRQVKEWQTPPGEDAGLYAMTADDQDRIWVVATRVRPNQFIGFDPKTEQFTTTEVPSGARSIRHMMFHAATGTIWFGTDAGTIGRATVRPAA